jgi:hypothetical protein
MYELIRKILRILLFIKLSCNAVWAQNAGRYDVVIDEILADPTPVIGLPTIEFIELKNVSSQKFNLLNWKVTDGSSTAIISASRFLEPDSFIVICPTSAIALFSNFGAAVGVTNFPSLNNDADKIILLSPDNRVIHAVAYNTSWFNSAVKSEGGWTLEMVDPFNACAGGSNWKASVDPSGGTPCRKNSVDAINPDRELPSFIRAYALDSFHIVAIFNEPLDSASGSIAEHYALDHGIGNAKTARLLEPLFSEVELSFPVPIKRGLVYQLAVNGVTGCSSNMIGEQNKQQVGLAEDIDSMNVVINEILFNSGSAGSDYIEFFNRAEKIIDASTLYVANRAASGQLASIKRIIETPLLVFPGDYLTISDDIEKVQTKYLTKNPNWLIQVTALPSLPNEKGTIVLLDKQGKLIDELNYDEDWHFALINNREGIALERIDPMNATQLRENWTSAASTAGFGTPTYENSQFRQHANGRGQVSLEPTVFSPDGDGFNDICFIHYELNAPNYVANITIFDANGQIIRRLYKNASLSQNGFLRWDGLGENRKLLPVGVYIIYTETFNLAGKTKKFKNVVILAKKF